MKYAGVGFISLFTACMIGQMFKLPESACVPLCIGSAFFWGCVTGIPEVIHKMRQDAASNPAQKPGGSFTLDTSKLPADVIAELNMVALRQDSGPRPGQAPNTVNLDFSALSPRAIAAIQRASESNGNTPAPS